MSASSSRRQPSGEPRGEPSGEPRNRPGLDEAPTSRWRAAWQRQGRRRRVSLLLAVALGFLLAAGVSYEAANPGLASYRTVVAEVVEVSRGDPATIVVAFETSDGEQVTATTDRLTFVPIPGGPVPIQYDPSDPEQVAMQGYSSTSILTLALVGGFAIALAGAWFAFRGRTTA